ncbi:MULTISPECIES: sigma 54-interacting transcriptional regulator [unclassified Sedimentibacter]|uniref:sigma 54-interacting transcriptional regulator n=1 Tax=unclassified Sedimentibacter TaxID=2649220 RepID=UPI0027E18B63|nr:sigma 54-interacting transcriptional regulator [Sedimentibacter sp. MB35-C1]WMJ77593.1 sigma 54-interacting transcriptional regulator [Sedimentibacter sp. MB35-C1]
MKIISVIYRNRENMPAIEYLKNNLESIFEKYIKVNNIFLNELFDDEIIEGDIFLVLFEYMIYPLKKHIQNFDNVILMTRGIDKKFISDILAIPQNTDVLVVNDSYESTIQTTNTFYELGISSVNFISYEKDLDTDNYYDDIKIAITPNEEDLVPKHIKNIINIGYRQIGYDTLIKIMQKLQLSHKLINRNIIRHMNSIVEPNATFKSNYLNSYLKSEMLNMVIFNSHESILLTDNDYNLVYSNNKSNIIFGIDYNSYDRSIRNFVDKSAFEKLINSNTKTRLIKINEENYTVEKTTVMLMDQIVGYYIILRNEKDIRDLEINLKNHLIDKGLFAKYSFSDIVYKSDSMMQCINLSKKASLTDFTIMIRGESGTGKELLAQSIHKFSYRRSMPFVAVNCAALPESLLESQLFGYESGSFTGASKSGKIGLFEQANTGTLFLDEIGDISQNLQVQLLRVIQEKQIMRIGSNRLINVDVRIIVATNKNLEDEVQKGKFRSDLYYRLNVIPVEIPPLRERQEDILLLAENFLGDLYYSLTEEQKKSILNYSWHGNVRELESAVNYYKTLGIFPNYMSNKSNNKSTANSKNDYISLILSIIKENTDSFHGIGRTQLMYELKEKGVKISDSKIRTLLKWLHDNNYIETRKGRAGNMVTQEGINYLNSL